MIRFLLSVIILTLLITYAVIPFIKYVKKFLKSEKKRIEKSLSEENVH